MKIVIAASELEPFVSSGDLAKSVYNLARAASKNFDVECIVPLFSTIDKKKYKLKETGEIFQIPVGDKFENAEIWKAQLPKTKIKTWFVGNQYFARDGLYCNGTGDYPDNSERFVFFSRAVIEFSKRVLKPDLIHCNDWQTALIPVYLKELRENDKTNVKTVLSVHDVRFQGKFWSYDLPILNLGKEIFTPEKLEFYSDINFLKGGIVYSDALCVSDSDYLEKISQPQTGCGMDGVIRKYSEKIFTLYGSKNESLPKIAERLLEIYASIN